MTCRNAFVESPRPKKLSADPYSAATLSEGFPSGESVANGVDCIVQAGPLFGAPQLVLSP
jgi:hypothetical protein